MTEENKTIETPSVEAPKVEPSAEVKPSLMEKVTNILQANTIIGELKADNARLITALEESKNEVENLKSMGQTVATLKADYDKQIADLKAEYQTKIDALSVDTQVSQEKIEEKAIQKLANIGIEVGAIEVNTKVKSLYEQYSEMPHGQARLDFFNQHRAAILKESEERIKSK